MNFSDLINKQLFYGSISLFLGSFGGLLVSVYQHFQWGSGPMVDFLWVLLPMALLVGLLDDLDIQVTQEAITYDRMTTEGDWVVRHANGTPYFLPEAFRWDTTLANVVGSLLPAVCIISYAWHFTGLLFYGLVAYPFVLVYYALRKVYATRYGICLIAEGRMLDSGYHIRIRDGTPQILVDALDGEGMVWRDDAGTAYHEKLYKDKLGLLKSLDERPSRSPSLFRFN